MRQSSKHGNVFEVRINPTGGLNYTDAPINIKDNELSRALNFYYDQNTLTIRGRPGTDRVTTTRLSSPIRKLYWYVKSSGERFLVCASGNKLYYLGSNNAWVEIGTIQLDTTPSFLTYNNILLIADGGSHIRTWNGTNYSHIPSSPPAGCLAEIKGRVVANAVNDPDAVFFSAIEDETTWSGGTSEALRCGYRDGMMVNGFAIAPGGNDLIVSKRTETQKVMYRVNLENPNSANWYAVPISVRNASYSHNTIITAMNDVYFCDSNGFKSLVGVEQYGDIQTSVVGVNINSTFAYNTVIDEINYIPTYNSIWILNGTTGRVFVYHPLNRAFTDLLFPQGRMQSIVEASGGTVYLGCHDGYLYKLNKDTTLDQLANGSRIPFSSVLRTKLFTFPRSGILRRSELYLTPYKKGEGRLYAIDQRAQSVLLKSVTLTEEGLELYDANMELHGANQYLYDLGAEPWFESSRNRVRATAIGLEFATSSGSVGISEISAEFALVEGP